LKWKTASCRGNGIVSIASTFAWEGGTLGGFGTTTLQAGATLAISRSTVKTLAGRTLNTLGTTTWIGNGEIDLSSGATWNNAGTFTIQTDKVPFKALDSNSVFNNSGTLKPGRSVSNVDTTDSVHLQQFRDRQHQQRIMNLLSSGTSSGTFNLAANSSGTTLPLHGRHAKSSTICRLQRGRRRRRQRSERHLRRPGDGR